MDDHKLTKGDIKKALQHLEPEDRRRIKGMIKKSVEIMQEHPARVMFGELSAMELIAKLGIYFSKNKIDRI